MNDSARGRSPYTTGEPHAAGLPRRGEESASIVLIDADPAICSCLIEAKLMTARLKQRFAHGSSRSYFTCLTPADKDRVVDFSTPVIMETGKIGRLLTCASQGDIEGVRILLDAGLPVDSPDYDGRTAMHLAASEGHYDVVEFLLNRKADVNPVDRWRKTPLADARRYEAMNAKTTKEGLYTKVCELLVERKGSTSAPFEIDLDMQQLEKAKPISECELGDIRLANWRGTKVAARVIHRNLEKSIAITSDSQLIRQLSLLQRLRHPNIVQFLGAVTNFQNKSKPLVLVSEHLPNGDLQQLLDGKKRRKFQAKDAVNYALDIARGMNYLHQHRPYPIVHSELNPSNLLRDAAGHLKVAGLGLSKLIGCVYQGKARGAQNPMHPTYKAIKRIRCLYRAPELEKTRSHPHESVDVYSFGMILNEMFEGPPSLASRQAHEVVPRKKLRHRTTLAPNFKLRKLIRDCLARNPKERPTFQEIIVELEGSKEDLMKKPWWAPRPMIKIGSTLVTTVSQHWYNCVNNTKRALSHSIASVEDMAGNHGRSRRGETTNFNTIEEESQDEDKENALSTQT